MWLFAIWNYLINSRSFCDRFNAEFGYTHVPPGRSTVRETETESLLIRKKVTIRSNNTHFEIISTER
jgi:hypothetical protein